MKTAFQNSKKVGKDKQHTANLGEKKYVYTKNVCKFLTMFAMLTIINRHKIQININEKLASIHCQ